MSTSRRRITGVSGRERGDSIADSRRWERSVRAHVENPHMNGTILSNTPKGHWEKGENAHGDKRDWSETQRSVVGLRSLGARQVACC